MQRRRVHAATQSVTTTGPLLLTAIVTESNGINAHGMRCSFSVEPENADANANGTWQLWCMPDELAVVPSGTHSVLEQEGSNAFLWAVGTWAASNQSPYTKDIEIRTSRNCQNGARMVLQIWIEGVSAGSVRYNRIMTYFTKSL